MWGTRKRRGVPHGAPRYHGDASRRRRSSCPRSVPFARPDAGWRRVRVIVALSLALALVGGAACQNQGATPPVAARATPDTADQTLFGVRVVMSDHGVQRSLLQADTAFTYDENSRFELRTVRSTFYTETGVKSATLTSRQGTYNVR